MGDPLLGDYYGYHTLYDKALQCVCRHCKKSLHCENVPRVPTVVLLHIKPYAVADNTCGDNYFALRYRLQLVLLITKALKWWQ